MNKDLDLYKTLVIANCKRIIDILENTKEEDLNLYHRDSGVSELKYKMRELRRDTVVLEKKLYHNNS